MSYDPFPVEQPAGPTAGVGATPGYPPPYQPPDNDGSAPDDRSAKEKASASAEAGKQAAGEVAETAADQAKQVAGEAKRQVRDVVDEAQKQVREQAAQQHRNAVSSLRSLADELHSMAQRSEQPGPATDLVAQAGDRAHSAASWLDQREPGRLLDEVRSFARRRPGTFLVGALAAGVLAGRLTRGTVAVHSEDSPDSGAASGNGFAAAPQVAPPALPTPGSQYGPDTQYGQDTRYVPTTQRDENTRYAQGAPGTPYPPGAQYPQDVPPAVEAQPAWAPPAPGTPSGGIRP